MQLRLSIVDPAEAAPTPRDVVVDAVAGAVFGEVRAHLARHVADGCADFIVGDTLIPDDAVIGSGLLVRGAILRVTRGQRTRGRMPLGSGLLDVHVVGGPGSGRTVSVGRGEHVIGRGPTCSVRLEDCGVSRAHSLLTVTDAGVRINDLGATNATSVDGRPLPAEGMPLGAGQRVRVGSTTLVIRRLDPTRAPVVTQDGVTRLHRRPRFVPAPVTRHVSFPDAPQRPEGTRAPLIASLAPVVLAVVLAVALSSPTMLLFALMSPVMLLGQWWSDRRHGRESFRTLVARHAEETAAADRELDALLRAEAAERHEVDPDLAVVGSVIHACGTRLWERRPDDPDYLRVRFGTATQPARVVVTGERRPDATVSAVPVQTDLATAGVLGLAGPRSALLANAGSLLVQVATWSSPRSVQLALLTQSLDAEADWGWATFLPHLHDPSGAVRIADGDDDEAVASFISSMSALVRDRQSERSRLGGREPRPLPHHVVVLDGARALRTLPGVAELLRSGPQVGVSFVCLDSAPELLPVETTTQLVLAGDLAPRATLHTADSTIEAIVPDLPTTGWLAEAARSLAPLEDATPDTSHAALPARVSFRDLIMQTAGDPADPAVIKRSWATSGGRPTALLGRSVDGPVRLDLAQDGPHTLIGGTTGSGKSELLQTLVAGLAIASPPDELSFVLVDYKGGSAFKECADLPHVLGLVTDLDEALTTRALTSLRAELKRREGLLSRAGAKDLDDYRLRRRSTPELTQLARLVIVVDEFKMLTDELPDFVEGLVRIAAVGRSLGVHLVLATQRPGGSITGDMRANISLRIALRVRDKADSDDVIESGGAAEISDRTPGRALVRAADGRLVEMQSAHVGGAFNDPTSDLPARPTVHRIGWRDLPRLPVSGGLPDTAGHEEASAPTELSAVVSAVQRAAREAAMRLPQVPWLPPLPVAVAVDTLPVDLDATGAAIPFGVVDRPDLQSQECAAWSLEDGNLGVAGGARSGRTTLLRTLAVGLAERFSPDELHVHVLTGTRGALADLESLPHVGTVAGADDPALVARVLARLTRLLSDSIDPAQHPGRHQVQHTVVLVDGWEALEESLDGIDHGAPIELLLRLARDGIGAGVRVVVTGGRAIVSGRLSGLLQRRLVLPMPDPLDLTLAGIAPAEADTRRAVGRAIETPEGHHLQVAHVGLTPDHTAQVRAVDEVGGLARLRLTGEERLPWRARPLPDRTALIHSGNPGTLVLGVGGDEALPVGIELEADSQAIVLGPPRSGRSTALTVLARQFLEAGRDVAVVTGRRSPLTALSGIHPERLLSPSDDAAFIALRREHPDLCVLIDDAEELDGTPIERALIETARLAASAGGFVAAAADLGRATSLYRGLVPELCRAGTGVVLGPTSPTDGDLLRVRVDVSRTRRPGRGVLVHAGETTPMQVADPTFAPTDDAAATP